MKHKPTALQFETAQYWRVMTDFNAKRHADALSYDDMQDASDELDVLSQYTDSPRLKRLASTAISADDIVAAAAAGRRV